MKASELIKEVIGSKFNDKDFTVDTCKAGDPDREIGKIAVCFIATVDVIRAAADWGADLLITHEPTYFDHLDNISDDPITKKKHELVESTKMTIYRIHDSMHFGNTDEISEGFLRAVKWEGNFDGYGHFVLQKAMSPVEIANDIEKKLGLRHVRIIGAREGSITKIGLFLGHRGDEMWKPFKEGDEELALCGEFCEWRDGEIIRDAAQLGVQKSVIVLGHAGSERDGMKAMAEDISAAHCELSVKYFECGELYTYTDTVIEK